MNESQNLDPSTPVRKILWAVDPFSDEPSFIRSTARSIASIRQGAPVAVQPVFVRLGAPPRKLLELWPEFISDLRKNAQYALDSKLGAELLPDILPLQILRNQHSTISHGVKLVAEHARELGAELIVLSSHGRQGLSRALLGSFAEALTLISQTPLFVTKPGDDQSVDLKEILFLTDFSDESVAAYRQLLDFAVPFGSRIAIMHKIGQPTYPTFELGHAYQAAYAKALDEMAEDAAQIGRDLAAMAKSRGLRAEVIIDRTPGSIASSAQALAEERGAMIALAAQSGALSATLLGSTTWQILRTSRLPVWVMHPPRGEPAKWSGITHQPRLEKELS